MHQVGVRQKIVDRVLARRGCYHWFDRLDPQRTALLVIVNLSVVQAKIGRPPS
jgi:ureidoacrylate peracid hydrolase